MESKTYIHYGDNRFIQEKFMPPKNRPYFTKPFGGLWASRLDAEYGWKDWCADNDFRECEERDSFMFTLSDTASVFHIKSVLDLKKLPQQKHELRLAYDLDFEEILRSGYDAIELHLSEDRELYWELYGWDCDSIIVLNKDVIVLEEQVV